MVRVLLQVGSWGVPASGCSALWGLCLQLHIENQQDRLKFARVSYTKALAAEVEGCSEQVEHQHKLHEELVSQLDLVRAGHLASNTRGSASRFIQTNEPSLSAASEIVSQLNPDHVLSFQSATTPVPVSLRLTIKVVCVLLGTHLPEPTHPKHSKPVTKSSTKCKSKTGRRGSTMKANKQRPSTAATTTTTNRNFREAEWKLGLQLMSDPEKFLRKLNQLSVAQLSDAQVTRAKALLHKIDTGAKDRAYVKRVQSCYGLVTEVADILCQWAKLLCTCRETMRRTLLELMQAKYQVESTTNELNAAYRLWLSTCSTVSGEWIHDMDLSDLYNMVI
eukprot:TRINITY_DN1944_c0_g1_i1.p1 TRINITY_DN1944_c0_g1~~TRINITY_DN1944_c0_g1_i1.p1  ORF type:complete len:334 (+),score=43.58 TRINITY_DN1944_c0_g1_i1:847-1848(+)